MTAIYDRRSGATHLVAEVVRTIIEMLGEGEADVDTLLDRLLGPPKPPDLPELVEGLSSVLPHPLAQTGFDRLSQVGKEDRTAFAERLDELVTTGLIIIAVIVAAGGQKTLR